MLSYSIHLSTLLILAAIAIDIILGDPRWFPHPVRLFGALIRLGDRTLHTGRARIDLVAGAALALFVVVAAAFATGVIVVAVERANLQLGALAAILFAWTTLALRGLDAEARKVERALGAGDDAAARAILPALVGRDPQVLSRSGIIRATVESVAESSCDGVIAPLFFLFVGGPVAAVAYKAINTLDSMIGHRTRRYLYFGRFAARLDDAANFIPARIAAFGIIVGAAILRRRGDRAFAACRHDAFRHPSPNSGYPEAAMAGALGFQLGGDVTYQGELEHRPRMGRPERNPEVEDIRLSCRMMYVSVAVSFIVMAVARFALRKFLVQG